MANLEKQYKEKLEEFKSLLKDLNELRKKGKQRTDESMNNKLEQLRQLMTVAEEQVIAKYDDESLNRIISKLSSELQCLDKLLEGRPVNTATEILANASGGLALRGILVGETFSDDCVKRIVLSAPTDVKLMNPLMTQIDKVENFSSKSQSDHFHRSLDTMGYSAAITIKGGRFGFNAEADFSQNYEEEDELESTCHRKVHFESRVVYSIVPTAACELNKFSLKLSQQALQELKSIDTLFGGSESLELVNKKCEDFLAAYGSHINVGVLHFGGVNKFVATYTSETESKSDEIKYMVRDALSAYVSASYSGLGFCVGGSVSADQINTHASFTNEYEKSEQAKTLLHTTRNGGPHEVNALQLWKIGLVTCNSTWALIDRGRSLSTDFVGIWKLIPNHKDEFEEPYRLETVLMTAWERMSGYLGFNDQELTFLKGREEIDLLIEKIAKWNSCPILPEKCIEYLQEMLKTVKEVEAHTSTNKYWANKLCTEVNISSLLAKVVELRDKLDPKNVSMIRFLIRKLVNPVGYREFPGKQMILKWAVITKTEDIPSLLAEVRVKNIPDLMRNLKEKFIPVLQIEHAKNIEKNVQVIDGINAGATVDMALCVGQLLKDLQSSGEEHEMFFLKVALLPLYYHWPTRKFETLLTMEKLQDFVQSIEESWNEFQVHKEKGIVQLEAFLIHNSLSSGHFDEGRESSENEFSETIKELRQVLSPQLNEVLNRYATRSPFNWVNMANVTGELASGNMSASEEKEVNIVDLENMASSKEKNEQEQRPVITTNAGMTAQSAFSDTLKALGLDQYFPSLISLLDAMVIKRTTGPLKLVDIPWTIIHKLLMIDFHARDHHLSVVNKSLREERSDDGGNFDFEALLEMDNDSDDEDKPAKINTLDAMVAIFTCCDNFLKQTLAQKLFVCKLAIPFLYPIGSEDNVGMSVWALRTINVHWHSNLNEASETPVTERPFPLVSFIRLGRPPLSKSKLINDILRDESHDTFFHHDCNNGVVERRIANGLVECSWFITGGREKDHLPCTTMLLNLRGDASLLNKQMKILQEISSVLFVIVTSQDLARAPNTKTCQQILQTARKTILFVVRGDGQQSARNLRAFYEAVGKDILKGVPIISSKTKEGVQKNASELKTEARTTLSEVLAGCSGTLIEDCAKRTRDMGIIIDECDDKACQEGKISAEKVVRYMDDRQIVDCKALLLPMQGNEWIEYCKLLKKQHRADGKGSHLTTYEANILKQKMDRLRDKQVEICNRLTPFIKDFMSALQNNRDVVMYFLKWMNLLLDANSRATLPGLRKQYHMVWTEFQETKKEQDKEKLHHLKLQVDEKESQLSKASLGLENLFRELGQIYEAVKESGETGKATRAAVEYLPERAAELLLNGTPLELVDGDASSVPIGWVSGVLSKLENIIGKKKLFVLSVLGIQSSGKSTLLNTMFGLQFAVSAGRCTRGAYMQLIPVDGDTNMPFDYVAVVDTEGLRAPELGQLKHEHDNELATLVIGLGDVTMINIKGENTAEMKDILQIAVHAFLRMNLVRKNIRDHRTCIFVHQNVPAANAEELMMHGCQKLQESLDHMAKEAALSESIADIHSFSQIINFDVQKHVWYFSDLWHGDPPMAPANPGYSEKVRSVRLQLLEKIALEQKTFLTASDLSIRLSDLWNGILADDFVFSFRNSLEVKAYNSLQSKYYALEWELQDKMKSWLHTAEIELKRCETSEDLENSYQSLIGVLSTVLTEKVEGIKTCLMEYFENCEQQEIVIQWQETKLNQLNFAVEQQHYEGRTDLLSIKEARRVEILQAEKWSNHEIYIMDKAVELADELKGKEASNFELEQKFELMWTRMVNELATKTADKDMRMDVVMDEILHQIFHAHGGLLRKELQKNPLNYVRQHTSLESSVPLDFVKNEDISVKRTIGKAVKNFFSADAGEFEARNKTVVLTRAIVKEISTDLKGLSKHDVKFNKSYATKIIQKVVAKIDVHNENADSNFTILPQYKVKLAVHVSRHCVQVFTLMQLEYNKKHGVKAKLQNYKNTAWSLFKNKVKQSTEEVIAGDLLTTHLETIVQDTVKNAIPRKCTEEVLRDFQMTKYYLMVKMMDDLAVKANFKKYKSYIENARRFALQWIAQYTDKKMFSRKESSSMSRYEEISKSHISRIMLCIARSVSHATSEVDGKRGMRMTPWIEQFCERVSEEIAVPVSTLMFVKDRSVIDFNNLQRIILDQLDEVQKKLEESFALKTAHSVEWDGSHPSHQIIDKIWGCPEQCPFCNEPCADTTPDHYDLSGRSHMCVQHRPQGIGGIRWEEDGYIDGVNFCKGQLFTETCNYDIQRNVSFNCSTVNFKCRDSGNCSTTGDQSEWHKNKEYKTYIPDWDIAPNPTNDVSRYWMWFMATYQHQLKDMYNAKLPDIPEDWMKISKAEALADLRKIHH
ncbi:interferon-induced very large GTPase 1-like [Lytechinus variegatus]|uniref:interferon-induced very large GTPase 1-like n=1 Tax=Lytechinus variegatus TaxID=7654 RepID=UPI001BB1CD30|nr:interferon-induced very large GTPase 1-like [Lytechinus variegatus]